MNKLEVNNVTKKYDNNTILDKVSFSLEENQTVAILGPNGCGKTTLFNVISGLVSPDFGSIVIDGADVTNRTGFVSYMPQDDLLLPYKTVYENICLPLILNNTPKERVGNIVREYFEVFKLTGTENRYPHEISGGMRQRAAFLRTYMYAKDIMLLDEPFSALDTITKNNMYSWYIDIIKKYKKTTMLITHNIDEALLFSDTIYILSHKTHNIIACLRGHREEKTLDYMFTDDFIILKKKILNILNSL